MRRHILRWIGWVFCGLLAAAVPAQGLTLRLGAAHWPPYTIKNSAQQPGLAEELLAPIFARLGVQLEVVYLPWSRALLDARSGHLDGLITAVPAEAEGLRLTRVPTFQYDVVFMTRADSPWSFRGADSLKNVVLGVVPDYGYGEPLDTHIAQGRGPVMRVSGANTVGRLIKLLQLGRCDAIAEDRQVLQWVATRYKLPLQDLREAGGLGPQPMYLALHPERAAKDDLLRRLDDELAKPATRATVERLRAKYLSAASQESRASEN